MASRDQDIFPESRTLRFWSFALHSRQRGNLLGQSQNSE